MKPLLIRALGCEVSGHQSQLAGGLAAVDGLLRLLSGDTTGDLYYQRDRVTELLIAEAAQNPWGLSQRRRDCKDTLPGNQPGGEKVDHADSGLESRSQSVRHSVR